MRPVRLAPHQPYTTPSRAPTKPRFRPLRQSLRLWVSVFSLADDLDDSQPKPKKKPAPQKAASQKAAPDAAAKVKKEVVKKEYKMPGQKRDTPDEVRPCAPAALAARSPCSRAAAAQTNPSRKFYSSLREQLPGSRMAEEWLLNHGLLSQEEAEEALKAVARRRRARTRLAAVPPVGCSLAPLSLSAQRRRRLHPLPQGCHARG